MNVTDATVPVSCVLARYGLASFHTVPFHISITPSLARCDSIPGDGLIPAAVKATARSAASANRIRPPRLTSSKARRMWPDTTGWSVPSG